MTFRRARLRGLGAICVWALLSHGLCGAGHAQPAFIPMPADLKVEPPAADVPATVARFAGAWAHGAWDGVLPHVLVVEAVDGHRLWDRGEIWKPAADDFLRRLKLSPR